MKPMKYLKLKPQSETLLRVVLYHMDHRSGATNDYARGIVVGVVSTIMAAGMTFDEAIDTVAQFMPNTKMARLTVPDSWEGKLSACLLARGKMLDE